MSIEKLLESVIAYDEVYIYGARIVSGTVYYFLTHQMDNLKINGFVVSKKNTETYLDEKVYEISEIKNKDALIIVSTIEIYHKEISELLKKLGFKNVVVITALMVDEMVISLNPKLDLAKFDEGMETEKELKVFMAKSHFDKKTTENSFLDNWIIPIQVGSDFTNDTLCKIKDNVGDNISHKNKNYCELTATYWIWKNVNIDYVGLCHYRRFFRLDNKIINGIVNNNIDVVLPNPIICLPNAREHHKYYVSENDFSIMLDVLKRYYPEYYKASETIFNDKLFYWHNMWIMKKEIFNDYASWLFDILEKVEQIADINGNRGDRYIGYLAESLTTLYFRFNEDRLKIWHISEKTIV